MSLMRTVEKDLQGQSEEGNKDMDDEWETVADFENDLEQSDVNCGVCYDILIFPTTLRCGHNFCRPCLAQWFSTSKKKECPVCRQQYREKPEINSLIRTLTEKAFKEKIEERKSTIMTSEMKKLVEQYDKAMTVTVPSNSINFNWERNRNRNGADFCSGILCMLGIVTIIYLVWYWRNTDDDLLTKKHVRQWTVEDVNAWLSSMPWTESYRDNFINKSIDGRLLVALNEEGLTSILNISVPLHKAAILTAIDSLRETGMKHPSDLWEYKSIHPGYALFLLYGIKDYPRLTILYFYWYDYYNMFLPFVHFTCPAEEYVTNLSMYEPLSTNQKIEFFTKLVFLPYFLVAQFTWEFLSVHFWTSRFILVNCLALTVIEAANVRWLMSGGWRDTMQVLKSHGKGVLGMVVCIIVWPIVPNWICDFFFYVALYFSPYSNLEKLYKIMKG
ncbi:bifunctional apoptosis regulator-like [Mytilus californianus]|uniref:bifunctional apoptosis regulator-like n=1 Tax=Mytilus californianus TaxID=6549 RepID=UPI002247762C|nr:bifunctional apoptosis regulator-like [Mytilus californianus]